MNTKKITLSCLGLVACMSFASLSVADARKELNVTARLQPSCTFDITQHVSFGDVKVAMDAFANGEVVVDCVRGNTWTLALDGGGADVSAVAGDTRRMISESGTEASKLKYELYADEEYSQVWGNNIGGGGGTGLYGSVNGVTRESTGHPYSKTIYAKIKSGDATKTLVSGDYADIVKATLVFVETT